MRLFGLIFFWLLAHTAYSQSITYTGLLCPGGTLQGSSDDAQRMTALLNDFYTTKQMGPLVENIYEYLPGSLKGLGDNPFKKLYSYLSEGLHNHTDEQCLSYSKAMDKLLVFTIKKVKEEQSELREIRDILSDLQGKG